MNKNKSLNLLASVVSGAVFSLAASTAALASQSQVLEYKLALAEDGETYEIWMRPSVAPKPDMSLTGQVTLKVPSAAEFKAIEVASSVEGADWIEASRVNKPDEAPDADYISFSFVGLQGNSAHSYKWAAEEEKLVFSFKNEGGCVDGVSIMADDDLFNAEEGNSANTNPGNQFTNLGWGAVGANNFKGVYGEAVECSS